MNVMENDIRNSHMQHRLRVKSAKAIVDDRAPLLHAGNFARFSKMKEDIETYVARHKDNARLLMALNKVDRTKGAIDTFRTRENSITPPYSKLPDKHRWQQEIDLENQRLGTNILGAKPELDTWMSDKFMRKSFKKKPYTFQYPEMLMEKYSHLEIPRDRLQLQKFLRPKVWFNLSVEDIRPLGSIVVELYTEAAPQIVMEFVRVCFAKQKERINFIRLFPYLWLEGNIQLDDKTLLRKNIEYDKRAMDHAQHAGILSFNVKNVFCSPKSILNFSISFKPLSVCNGRRVGFGRVCQGFRNLKGIEHFGNKNGKLYKEIIVQSCGVFN